MFLVHISTQNAHDVYIEIPAEDRQPGDEAKVGKLQLCLYGTRDAAHNWGETVASQLQECGFTRGTAFPSVYLNEADDVAVMVHGDDLLCRASRGFGEFPWKSRQII